MASRMIRRCGPACRSATWWPGCTRRWRSPRRWRRARTTGQGERVEVRLTNGLVSMLAYIASDYFATGTRAAAQRQRPSDLRAIRLVPDARRPVGAGTAGRRVLRPAGGRSGRAGLKTDPLYATGAARVANRARINAIVGGKLATQTTAHWVAALNAAGVPCGPVQSVDQMFADPQIAAQEMVLDGAASRPRRGADDWGSR